MFPLKLNACVNTHTTTGVFQQALRAKLKMKDADTTRHCSEARQLSYTFSLLETTSVSFSLWFTASQQGLSHQTAQSDRVNVKPKIIYNIYGFPDAEY